MAAAGKGCEEPSPGHQAGLQLPDPPPGAHAGVLGDVDGVEHRVVLHGQPQVGDGTGLIPLHQDVLGFQVPVSDRRLPCERETASSLGNNSVGFNGMSKDIKIRFICFCYCTL